MFMSVWFMALIGRLHVCVQRAGGENGVRLGGGGGRAAPTTPIITTALANKH